VLGTDLRLQAALPFGPSGEWSDRSIANRPGDRLNFAEDFWILSRYSGEPTTGHDLCLRQALIIAENGFVLRCAQTESEDVLMNQQSVRQNQQPAPASDRTGSSPQNGGFRAKQVRANLERGWAADWIDLS
jgi:hypothetical protein